MSDEDVWQETIKEVKRLKSDSYVKEINATEIELRRDKITTVPFLVQKKGKAVKKDDFSQMDGCLAKRFKREEFKIEARLDLHGVTEKEAFDKVVQFINMAYNQGKRCILIITGKGYDDTLFSNKGVLRKAVPQWLSQSEISHLILAFKNPAEALGGAGALYILLRKKS